MSYLRIILGVDAIRYPLTGIGRYVYELARGLKNHPSIAIVRLIVNGRWIDDLTSLTVAEKIYKHSLSTNPLIARLAWAPPAFALYRWWRSKRERRILSRFADHLYHGPNYFLPPHPGIAVATIHDLSVLRYPQFHPPERCILFRHEWPKTLMRARHLITPSQSIRQELIDQYGWPADRVTAVPLGVDPSFHPRSDAELTPVLRAYGLQPASYCLCVATIEPRKNILGLIEAHARLPLHLQRHFPLVLIGARGWKSDAIHRRIASAQASGQVYYLDYVEEAHLPLLIAGARLFIFPSFYEGFGLPPLEAMASGVPVVTSNCPALVELTQETALHIDPYDIDDLTRAIQRGLEDEAWRAQASAAGIERARRFTWANCIKQTVSVYDALIAHSH